jgi:hypothetical protein
VSCGWGGGSGSGGSGGAGTTSATTTVSSGDTGGQGGGQAATSTAATGGAGTGGQSSTSATTTSSAGTGGSMVTCPGPGAPDCSPGSGTGDASQCFDATPCYLKVVQDAVKYVINTAHPEWIDWSDGNPRVLDANQNDYVLAVVDEVSMHDLCAIQDPNAGDEIVVKHDNDFAENFDILSSQGYARYGNGIHTATCAPAWF